jgi:hypothetical protein
LGDFFPGTSLVPVLIAIQVYGGTVLCSPIFPAGLILFIFAAFVVQVARQFIV